MSAQDSSGTLATPHTLVVQGLSKTFGSTRALIDVDLEIVRGEVHGLVGVNGSGKSTLIKTLSGFVQPDNGADATIAGRPLRLGDPAAAAAGGLRFVHQDLGLVDELDAVDNYALGNGFVRRASGTIDWPATRARVAEALGELGVALDPQRPVGQLSASARTAVAVARALAGWRDGAQLLVLDEPTASMPDDEVGRLFDVIRAVNASGLAVIYVSHHLDEVFELTNRVTVLRDGRRVATVPTSDIGHDDLVELMTGGLHDARPSGEVAPATFSPVALSANSISTGLLRGVDVSVCVGEIVGIAGLSDSGREHLAKALFGAIPRTGTVVVRGETVAPNPIAAIAAGVALVPAERLRVGLIAADSARANLSLPRIAAYRRLARLHRARETADAEELLHRTKVNPDRDPERVVATLSGGNQQKVLLARWLGVNPRVLLLDEPTQGVDIAAKSDVHRLLREAARTSGLAVLVCSTDSIELADLCDRVIVLCRGSVEAELLAPVSADDIERHCLTDLREEIRS